MGFAADGLDDESKREIDNKNVVTNLVSKKIIIIFVAKMKESMPIVQIRCRFYKQRSDS